MSWICSITLDFSRFRLRLLDLPELRHRRLMNDEIIHGYLSYYIGCPPHQALMPVDPSWSHRDRLARVYLAMIRFRYINLDEQRQWRSDYRITIGVRWQESRHEHFDRRGCRISLWIHNDDALTCCKKKFLWKRSWMMVVGLPKTNCLCLIHRREALLLPVDRDVKWMQSNT